MGNTLFTLLVKLGMDISGYKKGLDEAEGQAEKSSKQIGMSLKNIGSSMTKVGSIMTATMTLPIIAGMGKAVQSASDLNESINKTQVVFKENGDAMLKWSENSAKAFGLSRATALDAAGGFGAMFGAMGVGSEQSLKMSQGLVQLAADMGSLYNVDPSEMLEKLRSGMAGEAEPLRVFGVMITEANVKAQALKMGLGDATGALSDQEKALARYALIQQQASVAQGDFSNTATGMANSTRIMKAEFENLSASFGQQLIPIAISLMQSLIPILEAFNNMSPATKNTILGILGIVAVIGPLLVGVGQVVTAIGTLITFFGSAGAGGTALATIGTFLSGTVFPAIAAAVTAAGLPVIALIASIGLLIATIAIFGKDAWNTITNVRDIIAAGFQKAIWWVDSLGGAFHGIANAMQNVLDWILRLQEKLLHLRLPSWLQPGSPTPFEMGLVGISKQMDRLSNISLPSFNANLELSPQPIGSMADTISNSINVNPPQSEKVNNFPSATEIGKDVAFSMLNLGVVK